MDFIQRRHEISLIRQYREVFPVVAIVGPRQSGKTTLAMSLKAEHHFDLEDPRDYQALDDPMLALESLEGLIVLDEIQRKPDLFPALRVLVDQDPNFEKRQFLILGSASPDLILQSSETLAGRIGFLEIGGFRLNDVDPAEQKKLWIRGGLPRAYLARSDQATWLWHENYVRTFLERDLANAGISMPATAMRQFWEMLAHNHGGLLNLADLARSFGVSENTIKRYAQILQDSLVIRLLQPWHSNGTKRIVKRPKIYIRDSGILHHLLGIKNLRALLSHPKLGASWEGFALEYIIRTLSPEIHQFYFWATHSGAEVDLVWTQNQKTYAIEFKYNDAPKLTRSMSSAVDSLDLQKLWVIKPAGRSYQLSPKIEVISLETWISCIPSSNIGWS